MRVGVRVMVGAMMGGEPPVNVSRPRVDGMDGVMNRSPRWRRKRGQGRESDYAEREG